MGLVTVAQGCHCYQPLPVYPWCNGAYLGGDQRYQLHRWRRWFVSKPFRPRIAALGNNFVCIVGHVAISNYLLVPHYEQAADWAIMAFVLTGCLAGYLWHNSYPSAVRMGDAGSRPIGLMLGVLVLACGKPFLILVVAFMVLVNGATGMVKVALLRFFKIGIFRQIRYPLHDHVRHNMGWSNTQVLVRFMLLQAVGTPILLVLLLKVR
jgi:phospho-N-acetylmuramoyl-pentapeptide-transferase